MSAHMSVYMSTPHAWCPTGGTVQEVLAIDELRATDAVREFFVCDMLQWETLEERAAQQQRRSNIANELLETEVGYVAQLRTLVQAPDPET